MFDLSNPSLTDKQRQILVLLDAARQTLAPEMTSPEYFRAVTEYENSQLYQIKNPPLENRINNEGETIQIPDNSEIFEALTYHYHGLEAVLELLSDPRPVAFVGWHHGARDHVDYALVQALPDLAIFTRRTFQHGAVLSTPMGPLGLLKMQRFLEDGRPIFYFLDGAPQGASVQLSVLGTLGEFSISPITMFQSIEGLRSVPLKSCYVGVTGVQVEFLPALEVDGKLANMDEGEILAGLFEQLHQNHRKRAPNQVLVTYSIARDRLAREANEARARERQKTI